MIKRSLFGLHLLEICEVGLARIYTIVCFAGGLFSGRPMEPVSP